MNALVNTSVGGIYVRTEKHGDAAVIEEVIDGDCYGLRAMKAEGFDPSVIVDVGAHIGTFSALAHHLWPDATIYAFEPTKRSFELLLLNVPKAQCYNAAVHYGDEPLVFADDIADRATGGGFACTAEDYRIFSEGKTRADGFLYEIVRENIPTTTLNGIGAIDLLKIDCEGGEWNVLARMSNAVKRIVGEYHLPLSKGATWETFKAMGEAAFPHLSFTPRRLADIELFEAK